MTRTAVGLIFFTHDGSRRLADSIDPAFLRKMIDKRFSHLRTPGVMNAYK